MTFSALAGRMRARLNRMITWIGMFSLLLNIGNFAAIYRDMTGIPIPVAAVLIVAGIAGVSGLIVYAEERFGWWGEESRHIWDLAGWSPGELNAKVDKIMKRLDIE